MKKLKDSTKGYTSKEMLAWNKNRKKKSKVKAISYEITFENDQLEPDIRWIICQHCKKPVYGTRTMKDAFLPNDKIVSKWKWKSQKKPKSLGADRRG